MSDVIRMASRVTGDCGDSNKSELSGLSDLDDDGEINQENRPLCKEAMFTTES